MRVYFAVFALVLLIFEAECQQDLDALIREVFGTGRNDETNDLKTSVEEDTQPCTCVPYYLCKNNSMITDGSGLIDIRVNNNPCNGYIDVCCPEPLEQHQSTTPQPALRQGCGKRNPDGIGFRISGNEDGEAQFGEFPWMIAILSEEETPERVLHVYHCGGSLIHPQVVVTAAHCVTNRKKVFRIRAGEWDSQANKELYPHEDAAVREIVIHPQYSSGSLYNDIALIFLNTTLRLGNNIDTVCLPSRGQFFDYSRCFASGWGKNVFGQEGKYQVILKKVELPVVPREECEKALKQTRLGPYFRLHDSFICAGGEPGKDTCNGDGGSPLVCPVPNAKDIFVQVGIVSWGIGCGQGGTPGVYASTVAFRDWIDNQMLYHGLDTRYYEE